MYFYKIGLINGCAYIVKSKEQIGKLLEEIETYEWRDYVLAEPTIMYVGNTRVNNNVVVIKSCEIVSIDYYVRSSAK